MSGATEAGRAVGALIKGRYRIERLIGEGGLAAVYEALDVTTGEKRAIKLLHAQYRTSETIGRRFYQEAQTCYALRHPHICVVESYDYAEDGAPFLVMELLTGFNVEDYLMRRRPMTPEQAIPIVYGALQALTFAHERNIVHRDIKPANLFLVPTGGGRFTIKVLDFGIAKVMDAAGGMNTKTRTGAVLGTPGYMSPEQIRSAKAVDSRTDVWAMGVVLFEMLTCLHPFGEEDDFTRMVHVLQKPPMTIGDVSPELQRFDAFFKRALATDANNRFQSIQEMADALRVVAEGTSARIVTGRMQTAVLPAFAQGAGAGARPMTAPGVVHERAAPSLGPSDQMGTSEMGALSTPLPGLASRQHTESITPPPAQRRVSQMPARNVSQMQAQTPTGAAQGAPAGQKLTAQLHASHQGTEAMVSPAASAHAPSQAPRPIAAPAGQPVSPTQPEAGSLRAPIAPATQGQGGIGVQLTPNHVAPAHQPSHAPAHQPSLAPAHQPSQAPGHQPSQAPAQVPGHQPSQAPGQGSVQNSAALAPHIVDTLSSADDGAREAIDEAGRPKAHTKISGQRPAGMPSIHSDMPPVPVETVRDIEKPGPSWALTIGLAITTLLAGILVGYLIGYHQ